MRPMTIRSGVRTLTLTALVVVPAFVQLQQPSAVQPAAIASLAERDRLAVPDATASVQAFDTPQPGARSPRNASYDIDVFLDHAQRALRGRATLRWRNISSHTATELQFHLYWNAWRHRDSTWMRERRFASGSTPPRDDAWGSIDVTAIRVRRPDGAVADVTTAMRFIAPDDGNTADRTVMTVPAPAAIGPTETIDVEIEWRAKIPRPFARTGYIDDYYFIAQWFPKIGVLENAGWNTHQFHAATEFYADFGVYDVDITVPRDFIVGATGRETARADNPDGTTTHRYRGEDVHDFAWTASPRFLESRRTFEHPSLNRVEMRLLLQPEHAGQEGRHFDATAATLRHFGEWFGAYPYDHITIVDPAYQSGSGGMEYPTLFTAGTRWRAPRAVTVPESVTIHEAAHQWWYGIVATNEFEAAWMDEGLTMYGEPRVTEAIGEPNRLAVRFFGGVVPWVIDDIRLRRETNGNRLPTYRLSAEADAQSTPTFRYWPATATPISYDKTALWLHTLERHLGWPVMQRILATYFERWKFRHPQPQHFFAVANEISGQDLSWYFDQVYRGSNTFDYAVQELVSERQGEGRYRTTVVARRLGEATFPVDVVTTFENGERVKERWDGRDRRVTYVYERRSRASMVQVDPERVLLLDVNYTNNSRTLAPRAAEASRKWALKWMVWMQDLMLTYAFFV
jgi:aminopeptidase N